MRALYSLYAACSILLVRRCCKEVMMVLLGGRRRRNAEGGASGKWWVALFSLKANRVSLSFGWSAMIRVDLTEKTNPIMIMMCPHRNSNISESDLDITFC